MDYTRCDWNGEHRKIERILVGGAIGGLIGMLLGPLGTLVCAVIGAGLAHRDLRARRILRPRPADQHANSKHERWSSSRIRC